MIPLGVLAQRQAAASTWTPLDLGANLVAWWDAADTSTITDAGGGAVSAWADKSGNGLTMIQATAAARPITGTRTENGLNVIDFNGSQWLNTASMPVVAQPFTACIVTRFDDPSTGVAYAPRTTRVYVAYITSSQWRALASTSGADLMPSTVIPDTALHAHVVAFDGATSEYRIDGTSRNTANAGTSGLGTPAAVIGGSATTGGAKLDGIAAEALVVAGKPDAPTMAALENYLLDKWGI